jgi:ubiquinone/menaquinone biosynthesis C-methylase UbiE
MSLKLPNPFERPLFDPNSAVQYQEALHRSRLRDAAMDLPYRSRTSEGWSPVVEEPNRFNLEVFEALKLNGIESILNVASGDGLDEITWAAEYGHCGPILGLDIPSYKGQRHEFEDRFYSARQAAKSLVVNNVDFIQGFAQEIPMPDGSVDVLTNFNGLHHMKGHRRVFSESLRVGAKDAKFAFTGNGVDNKTKHHRFLQAMGARTRTVAPKAFSSKFSGEKILRVVPLFFRQVQVIRRTGELVIRDELERNIYLSSIDTYLESFHPRPKRVAWKAARSWVRDQIDREIEEKGEFTDNLDRVGIIVEQPRDYDVLRQLARIGILR